MHSPTLTPHENALRQAYTRLAQAHGTLFHQPWYLDALCGPQGWGLAALEEEDGAHTLHAAWPYYSWRRAGLTHVAQPPLALRLGPLFHTPWPAIAWNEQQHLAQQLLASLPPYALLDSLLPAAFGHVQPFLWQGLQARLRYSYIVPTAGRTKHALFAQLADATRRQVNKAEQHVRVATHDRPPLNSLALYQLVEETYTRQRRQPPFTRSQVEALVEACTTQGQGLLLLAIGTQGPAEGALCAAAFFGWDDHRVYYLLGAYHEPFKTTGAMSMLLWQGILAAHTRGLLFDCGGSMQPGIARFFAGFGCTPEPYLRLFRYRNPWLNWLHARRKTGAHSL